MLLRTYQTSWSLSFAERPSKLFSGVEKRLTIWVGQRGADGDGNSRVFVSNYRRWFAEERPVLFATVRFVEKDDRADLVGSALAKIRSPRELEILHSLAAQRPVASFLRPGGGHLVYYTRKLRYFVIFLDFIPGTRDQQGHVLEPSELKELRVDTERDRDCLIALLNSNLFFWFFSVYSDVRNVNARRPSVNHRDGRESEKPMARRRVAGVEDRPWLPRARPERAGRLASGERPLALSG